MNRREFFGYTFLLGATTLISTGGLKAYGQTTPVSGINTGKNKKRVVYIFLRGGADFLALFPPSDLDKIKKFRDDSYNDTNYLSFSDKNKKNGVFRYHKELDNIKTLLEKGAFITHTASMHASRSHFFQQDLIESGSATSIRPNGFLARVCLKNNSLKPLAMGKYIPRSLKGKDCIVIQNKEEVAGLIGNNKVQSNITRDEKLQFLMRKSDSHNEEIKKAQADYRELESSHDPKNEHETLEAKLKELTMRKSSQAQRDNFVNHMKIAAQILNTTYDADLVTVEYTGWDTHRNQSIDITGKIQGLAEGILAFQSSLTDKDMIDTTIVIMSEFGRTVRYNANNGTDHGAGSMMLVLGGDVNQHYQSSGWDLEKFNDLSGNEVPKDQIGPSAALTKKIDYRYVMHKILSKYYQTDLNIFDNDLNVSEPSNLEFLKKVA